VTFRNDENIPASQIANRSESFTEIHGGGTPQWAKQEQTEDRF
jgi:hypothetical protein